MAEQTSGANPSPSARADDSTFMGKAWQAQHKLERKAEQVRSGRFARVLRMARKPEPDEFRQSATIVLVGIAVIGGIGFLVYLGMSALLKAFGAN